NADLNAELARLRDDRYHRGEHMVEKLQALGYPITFGQVRGIAGGATIVRPHVAQALVEAGVVPTVKDAFPDELTGSGGRARAASAGRAIATPGAAARSGPASPPSTRGVRRRRSPARAAAGRRPTPRGPGGRER